MADVAIRPATKVVGGMRITYLESAQRAFEAKNHALAFNDFQQAAEDQGETLAHCAEAYRMLGQYYQLGFGGVVAKDLEEAKKYYSLAFESGDQNAGMLLRGLDPAKYERSRQRLAGGAQPAILAYRQMQQQQLQMQQRQAQVQHEAQERQREEMYRQQRQQGERDFRPDTW